MNNNKERNKTDRPTDTGGRRLTFREAVTLAEDQIALHEYPRRHILWGVLHDLCRVMAEIYMMSPTATVRVAGEQLEARLVADVYREVTPEMAETLAAELQGRLAGVTNMRAYLRSALYIKAFEYEACEVRLEEQIRRETGAL